MIIYVAVLRNIFTVITSDMVLFTFFLPLKIVIQTGNDHTPIKFYYLSNADVANI
jgi:hypothetical protein